MPRFGALPAKYVLSVIVGFVLIYLSFQRFGLLSYSWYSLICYTFIRFYDNEERILELTTEKAFVVSIHLFASILHHNLLVICASGMLPSPVVVGCAKTKMGFQFPPHDFLGGSLSYCTVMWEFGWCIMIAKGSLLVMGRKLIKLPVLFRLRYSTCSENWKSFIHKYWTFWIVLKAVKIQAFNSREQGGDYSVA